MKFSNITATILFSTLLASTAFASGDEGDRSNNRNNYKYRSNNDVRECVHNNKPRHQPSTPANGRNLQCGDVITESITILNDLYCPDTTGFALTVYGSNIVINGNGKKIEAPNAAAGLYIEGSNVSVVALKVSGLTHGYGVLGYESPGIRLSLNDFSNNYIGIMLYADRGNLKNAKISGNKVTNSQLFAMRTGSDGAGKISDPAISWNDFSRSGSYAMHIKAESYELSENDYNLFLDSNNGIYLSGTYLKIEEYSLKKHRIKENGIFIDSVDNVVIKELDVSSSVAGDENQKRIGLDLYRVKNFKITKVIANNNDVGLKFETELGISPNGSVKDCKFHNNSVSGVMIVSYDDTSYGELKITKNSYKNTDTPIILGSTTVIDEESILSVN